MSTYGWLRIPRPRCVKADLCQKRLPLTSWNEQDERRGPVGPRRSFFLERSLRC